MLQFIRRQYRFFFLCCFILLQQISYAQKQDVMDSLQKALNAAKADTVKISLLNSLSVEFKNNDEFDKAIASANEAKEIAERSISLTQDSLAGIVYKKGFSDALNNLGGIYLNQGDYAIALDNFSRSLKIRESIGDQKGMARCLLNMGIVLKNQGDYPGSLEHYFRGLKLYEILDDKKGISNSYNNIGIVYNKKGDFPKALEYYFKAMHIYETTGNKQGMSSALLNIGIIYSKKNNYDTALIYYFKSLKLKEALKDKNGSASALNNIGNVYEKQGNYNKALEYYFKSLDVKETIGDKQGIASSYNNIGTTYLAKQDYHKSLEYFEKSFAIAQEIKSLEDIKQVSVSLSDLYEKTNQPAKALKYYKIFIDTRDSLYNEENTKKIVKAEMNFEFEKKQQIEKLEQEKKDAIQKEKLQLQRIGLLAVVVIVILLTAFLFLMYRSFRLTQKQNKIIEEKNKELEKLSIVASETANGVFITNANGEIEWFNEGFSKLFGWTSLEEYKEKRGRNIYEVSGNSNITDLIKESIEKGKSVTYENATPNKNGDALWIKTSLTPVFDKDGKLKQLVFIETDVTELKKAKETAEQSLQIQEQFLANTSHEIRTPMNGVLGMTRQLLETPLNKEQAEYLNAIKESSNNLLHVVNDILDISKIRAGKIVFERSEFRVADMFKSLQFMLQYKTDEKHISLITNIDESIPPVLIGDPVRLNQVLLNLTGNAIKFTEKGNVTLFAEKVTDEKDSVTILFCVTDTGIGIPEDKLDFIFETFAQAETNTTKRYGGTGLGLSISKIIIEQLGGKITVKSKLNEGSSFCFNLTLEKGDPDWKGHIVKPTEGIPKRVDLSEVKLLLVEDNVINQRVALFELNKWKVKADVANNATQAFDKLKNSTYDIILMDISMPGMDGVEATRFIRTNFPAPTNQIPIMAMTASALQGEKERCFEAGMNDYISKPFNPVTLYKKIVKWCLDEKTNTVEEEGLELSAKKSDRLTDLSIIRDYASGDVEYIKEMIQIYIESMPEYLSELKKIFEQKKWDELGKQAHKMKAPVAYFGVTELRDVLLKIEVSTIENIDEMTINDLIKEVISLTDSSINELRHELNKVS